MKKLFFVLGFLLSGLGLSAQNPADVAQRTALDPQFAPFYHGVASGDPLPDRVIIWTRVTPDSTGPITVNWAMATDTGMMSIVQTGNFTTHDTIDHTVKVDVSGLTPNTWYFYRFEVNGRYSVVGRTRTAPLGPVDSLRFAVVSCANYPSGYYNAYEAIANRNDVCAVLHLGDYIYENGNGTGDRAHEPPNEIIVLDDYRARHSQYKLDTNLRWLHQNYPFIVVWDDHETANNSWREGAEQHQANEGLWEDRKLAGIRAYLEWMPIRRPDPQDSVRIWRTVRYGDLAEFMMLDTRLYDRDEQTTGNAVADSARKLIGPEQLAWVTTEMDTTTAHWKVIGQQVMMAPLEIPFVGPVNTDQWDGYQAERQRLYDSIMVKSIENVVVLTGDIHTAWANDLPYNGSYDPNTGANSVAVEFVTTSITTANASVTFGQQIIQQANPHMKYINLADHGYLVLDLNQDRAKSDFWLIDDIDTPGNYDESWGGGWFCRTGNRFLEQDSVPAQAGPNLTTIQPPRRPANPAVGVEETLVPSATLIGAYPNPFSDALGMKYYLFQPSDVRMRLMDAQGRVVKDEVFAGEGAGLHYREFSTEGLASGLYVAELIVGEKRFSRKLVRE